jgi:transcriptional regulator with XRE-family HTH domain
MSNLQRVSYAVKVAVLLRALRNGLAFNQDELASAAKCARPTVNRIEALDKASPRADTLDSLFEVFRELGVEVQMGDEEISIRFTKAALLAAEERIKSGRGKSGIRVTATATVIKGSSSE